MAAYRSDSVSTPSALHIQLCPGRGVFNRAWPQLPEWRQTDLDAAAIAFDPVRSVPPTSLSILMWRLVHILI